MEKDTKVTPKFKTKFLDQQIPADDRIAILKQWCEKFIELGLMPSYGVGAYGNLSFRLSEGTPGFIITASGLKETAALDNYVAVEKVDMAKLVVFAHGTRKPSSESMLHSLIYQKRKDVNAIFHGHGDKILKNCQKLSLICTAKEEPYGTLELAREIEKALAHHSFLVVKNHGFLSFGKDMDEAGKQALEILAKC